MKALRIFLIAAIALLVASCSIFKSQNTAANADTGSSAGSALLGLYNQYKKDGKIDLSKLENILNLATLATNIKGIGKSVDTSAFVSGLVTGSKNLVNKANSAKVLESLTALAGVNLNSISNAANKIENNAAASAEETIAKINTASNNVSTAVDTLTALFKTLKK